MYLCKYVPVLILQLFQLQLIYFDEPNSTRIQSSSPDYLPDWVMGELGEGESVHEELWTLSSKEESSSATAVTYE